MILEKFRSTRCYKICGRIGVFALPICLIGEKWCKLVGGTGFGPALVGLFTLIPVSLFLGVTYLALTLSAVEEAKKEDLFIKTNVTADIGYVMYVVFMLTGWLICLR